jgi:putative oxidoreductase
MKKVIHWFSNPPVTGQSSIFIIRLLAGSVFFSEGILKFVYVNQGVGRFTKLGFPFPHLWPFYKDNRLLLYHTDDRRRA